PSRFLEEVPPQLLDDLGSPGGRRAASPSRSSVYGETHYSYEDEDQSIDESAARRAQPARPRARTSGYAGPKYNSIDNIAEFFASRGKKFPLTRTAAQPAQEKASRPALRPGQRVRHPKYGEGVVYRREGEGKSAKITVQFPRFGLKKLVEKYAQLERA